MSIRSGSATLTCEAGVSARTKERTHLPTSAQHETEHFHQYMQMPPRRLTGSGRDQRDTRIALTGRHRPDGLPTDDVVAAEVGLRVGSLDLLVGHLPAAGRVSGLHVFQGLLQRPWRDCRNHRASTVERVDRAEDLAVWQLGCRRESSRQVNGLDLSGAGHLKLGRLIGGILARALATADGRSQQQAPRGRLRRLGPSDADPGPTPSLGAPSTQRGG